MDCVHGDRSLNRTDLSALVTELYLQDRVVLYRQYFPNTLAQSIFEYLDNNIEWLHPHYQNEDGRVVHLPRLTANYGDRSYDYSGLRFVPKPWSPLLQELRDIATELTSQPFNALILQYYRNEHDRVGWHSDNDPCGIQHASIVSMSFGSTRRFCFRHKEHRQDRLELQIHHGDVLIMRGDLQDHYVHQVPSERMPCRGRINLTFRQVH